MGAFRYAFQEARNIRAAETRSRQQAALSSSIAQRKADAVSAAITKTSLGLGNVDNTSDANKPVSTAQQTAFNLKANASALAAKLAWSTVPASAGATGTAGQIAYDGSFIYVCVAANTWVRSVLLTW